MAQRSPELLEPTGPGRSFAEILNDGWALVVAKDLRAFVTEVNGAWDWDDTPISAPLSVLWRSRETIH